LLRIILSEIQNTTHGSSPRAGFFGMMRRSVLGRPGSDLLFQTLRFSTIGAEDFDGRVRDGIGYRLLAVTTRSAKDGTMKQADFLFAIARTTARR
jgi:hypothetical protein